jgi:hypothetical protein
MRSSIALVLVSVCATFGCKSDEPADASGATPGRESPATDPEPTSPPIGAWVVIDEQHGMFETANADGDRIPSPPPGPRIRVAEVVAIAGAMIEVRTIAVRPGITCASELGTELANELRFFVQAEALQSVLVRPKLVEFDDGTKLELAPGVPVVETGAKGSVRIGDASLFVALDDADVGRWFTPVHEHGDPLGGKARDPGLVLHYGEHSFTAAADPFLVAQERSPIEGGQLLTFSSACGQFVLRSELEEPPKAGLYAMKGPRDYDPDMLNAGIFGVMQHQVAVDESTGDKRTCELLRWTAAADTKLTWLGGGEAGTVLAAHDLPQSAVERYDRVCFEASGLDVCIETAKLERKGEEGCFPGPRGFGVVGIGSEAEAALGEEGSLGRKGGRDDGTSSALAQVRLAVPTVGTGLDPDIVRRIVRAHINELRACYDDGLDRDLALVGRIEIAFEIGAKGKVVISSVHASTLTPADAKVSACFAKAIKRWTFPKPQSGASVSVVYPFDLAQE